MSKFTPLLERFVDQVLEALRRAPIEDLLGLAEASSSRPPRQLALFREAEAGRERRAPKRRTSMRPAPPVENEITDPESLLASVIESPVLPSNEQNGATPPPRRVSRPRAVRAVAVEETPAEPVSLPAPAIREGESIVRASRAGVVIRRAKATQA
jgi:hypothetical protein